MLYSLIEMKNTGELHLFESGKSLALGVCMKEKDSICGRMTISDKVRIIFECKNEDDARLECAKIGRAVCGTCVSHLYATYDD